MHNPFARLASRDTARPSLVERAAALKASASRVIRRRPVDAASAALGAAALSATDPILAAIAKTRRLTHARAIAADLPQGRTRQRHHSNRSRRSLHGGRLMRVVPVISQAAPVPSLLGPARIGFETWRLRRIAAGLARANARGDANAARRWLARVEGALADLDRAQDRLRARRRPS